MGQQCSKGRRGAFTYKLNGGGLMSLVRKYHLFVEAFHGEHLYLDLRGCSQYQKSSLWLYREFCLFC